MMLWLKAFHLIMMVCWFAGLFYLPRLFVYHSDLGPNEPQAYDRFCLMEKRLFWGITTPCGILTLFFGIGLMHSLHYQLGTLPHWLAWKLGLITALVAYHLYCGIIVKKFKDRKNPHRALFYRWFNEVTLLILIGTVLLAVIKPH